MAQKPDPQSQTPDSSELGERARELARDAGRSVGTHANDIGARGMAAVGDRLHDAASYVDRQSRGSDSWVSRGEHAVAGRIEGTSQYLRDRDPQRMVSDLDTSIRHHPYRAMAAGMAIGWIIGRAMRRD